MEKKEKKLAQFNEMSPNTLMETLGIRYVDMGEDYLVATMPVTPKVHQPDGILNGGATMALAESVGSPVSFLAIDPTNSSVRGIAFTANHLRSVSSGLVTATAQIVHRGKTIHLVDITVKDDAGHVISSCRLTNYIITRRSPERDA